MRRSARWLHILLGIGVVVVGFWLPLRLLYLGQAPAVDWALDLGVLGLMLLARPWQDAQAESPDHWLPLIRKAIDFTVMVPFDLLALPWLGDHSYRLLAIKLLILHRIYLVRLLFDGLGTLHPILARLVPIFVFLPPLVHLLSCGWIALGSGTAGVDASPLHAYIKAVYWAMTTLTTVGYGDIAAKTSIQMLYVCAAQLIGVAIFGFIVSNVSSILTRLDAAREHHMNQLDRLETYMNYHRLPQTLRGRVRAYYRYMWQTRQGYRDDEVLGSLPPKLRADITLHMNLDTVRRIPLLANASEELVQDIMLELNSVVAVPGERIFAVGDPGDAIYFIHGGEVEILDRADQPLAVLHSGDFFGETALLTGAPRSATVRALQFCDLYVLPKAAFDQVVVRYPEFQQELLVLTRGREGMPGVDTAQRTT